MPSDRPPIADGLPTRNGGHAALDVGENTRGNSRSPSPVQREIIALFADALQQFGLSRSAGQIFGVIYSSARPLAFADVVALLGISNGSASQGLRFLRDLGAIKLVTIEGDRREHFVAETELRRMIGGLLQARLRPPLESGARRLQTLRRTVDASDAPDAAFLRQRIDSLEAWHRKTLLFLPFVESAIGAPNE